MILLILVGILASTLFWYFLVKPLNYWTEKGVKQTKPWILLGDGWTALFRRKSPDEFVQWLYNMFPKERYSGMYQFYIPTLVIRDPQLIKQLTVKDFDHFTDHRSFVDPDADPLWGKNLFALRGQSWKDMRSKLSGFFTSSKMKSMFNVIQEACENFVDYFYKKNEDLIEVELKDTFSRFSNDVIATTAFGIKIDSLAQPNNEFYKMGKELTDFSSFKKVVTFLGYLMVPKLFRLFKIRLFGVKISEFFSEIISETIKSREEKGIVRPDMIHQLLEARKGIKHEITTSVDTGFATAQEFDLEPSKHHSLTNEDITAQALIFFFAGFEMVANTMCFSLHELALNPDVQQKLREEIRKTSKEYNKITYDELLKMQYMDMVVSEVLRKWPPVIGTDRVCTKPYTIEPVNSGERPVHLPLGSSLFIPTFAMHRDPVYYPNPEKFDPERFSHENKNSIVPYAYIPFGAGPRNCIGSRFTLLEVKAMLYHLLMKFEVVPIDKTQIPLKMSKKSLNLNSEKGFWFGFKRIYN